MTDAQVWDMPSRRFWSMEKQIDRIIAGRDLRSVNIEMVNRGDKEQIEKTIERLALEIGEPYRIKRAAIVRPEVDAKAKFQSLF